MNIARQDLIFGLSYALDIAGKNNLSHSKSTAYLTAAIGRELKMDRQTILSLYYASLLHDIGVSNEYVMFEHCKIGAEMLEELPLPKDIATYVLYHHECCLGTGPFGLVGEEIPLPAQAIGLASAFDDAFGRLTDDFDYALFLRAQEWLETIRPLFLEPVVQAFANLMKKEAFLLDYFNHETKYKISGKSITRDSQYYDYDDVLKFAHCFAEIIDRRSHFSYTHSKGIANLARKATAYLGYDTDTQNTMYIAGLLHDIGKLHVSTDILHKNGPLTPEERFEINKHTYFTRKILEQIPGFEQIVEYASNHHERLDGKGYPYHMSGKQLGELERVMAICDVYQALTEERPYRASLPDEKVWNIIDDMAANGHLDKDLVLKMRLCFKTA